MGEVPRFLLLILATALPAVALSGCVATAENVPPGGGAPAWWTTRTDARDRDCDGVPDERDHLVRNGCAEPAREVDAPAAVRVQFAVAARDPARVSVATLAAVDAVAPPLLRAFTDATGGRLPAVLAGPPRIVPVPDTVTALDAGAPAVTRAFFADPTTPRDVHMLVLIADGVPLAGAGCGCAAWHERARNPSALGAPFDITHAFGAPRSLVGVTGLATADELAEADGARLTFRFLHETGHAWCCRLDRAHDAADALLAPHGGHWSAHVPAFRDDPLARHAEPADAEAHVWRYHAFTRVAMGLLAPADAAPVHVPATGKWVSAGDVLALAAGPA